MVRSTIPAMIPVDAIKDSFEAASLVMLINTAVVEATGARTRRALVSRLSRIICGEAHGGLLRIDSPAEVGYTEIAPWSGKR